MSENFWLSIILSILGGGTTVAVILAIRFRKLDRAKAGKTKADTVKVLAESYGLRAEAEIRIALGWEKMADELQKKLIAERQECVNEMAQMQLRHDEQITSLKGQILFLQQEISDLKEINTLRNGSTKPG